MTLIHQGLQQEDTSLDLNKVTDLKPLNSEALAIGTMEVESAFQSEIVIGKNLDL